MSPHHCISVALLSLLTTGALATDIVVVGLFPNKAVVQIDGGAPRTLSVGRPTAEGITLLSVERGSATFDVQGRQRTLKMGQALATRGEPSAASAVLKADTRGHYITDGQVNGLPIRFIVDTGATVVAIPAGDARRMSLEYRGGQPVTMNTANGAALAYRIKLDTVRVGGVSIHNVDAVVMEGSALPAALLGMSFLSRTEMKQDGQTMTLTKRY